MVAPGAQILDVTGPAEVFGRCSRLVASAAVPSYRVALISTSPRRTVATSCGIALVVDTHYSRVRGRIDTLLVAGGENVEAQDANPRLHAWLRHQQRTARRFGSICTGAFLLAGAGLLDERRATTHWAWADRLRQRYPRIRVESDPIFLYDNGVYTSAGVTAGMDLALSLVEADHGSAVALEIARQLVLYLRRPGSQSQFSAPLAAQLSDRDGIRDVQTWLAGNLHRRSRPDMLAERAHMSLRNFTRVFRQHTGLPPARYLERLRVAEASRRLQESTHGLERVASQCGFGSADVMRRAFARVMGVNPEDYRARFRTAR